MDALRLHRHSDGTIFCGNPKPLTELSVSSRWINSGGVPGVLAEKARLKEAGEPSDHLNLTPMFSRDGSDLIFEFENHGRCVYELVGMRDDSKVLFFELREAG